MGFYNTTKKAVLGAILAGSLALGSGLESRLYAQARVEPQGVKNFILYMDCSFAFGIPLFSYYQASFYRTKIKTRI